MLTSNSDSMPLLTKLILTTVVIVINGFLRQIPDTNILTIAADLHAQNRNKKPVVDVLNHPPLIIVKANFFSTQKLFIEKAV
ncbi:TPA: hypothetical protein HNC23_24970 [Escherichia coli]|nr:hypothetical protein [Escherichia coli]MIB39834.1 hypothetical protein [Escherichia coli]HAJ6430616.1 hypothetical protein [Escherichia coli]HAJ6677185.1 hypothetical protein [Escherichia coli]